MYKCWDPLNESEEDGETYAMAFDAESAAVDRAEQIFGDNTCSGCGKQSRFAVLLE